MLKSRIWNKVSLLELSNQTRLARKSVFNLRGINKIDYFPSYVTVNSSTSDSYLITPENSFILLWNMLTIILILFQSAYIPFVLSFDLEDYFVFYVMDTIITAFFIIDMILVFNTAICKNGNLIKDRRVISSNYFKSYFFIDLVSILAYCATPSPVYPASFASSRSYLNMLRLLKLVRLFKVDVLIRSIQDNISNRFISSTFMVIEILLRELLVSHFLACIFYTIGKDQSTHHASTWLTSVYFEDSSTFEIYITSLYWSITTMCTVGYGDIKPKTTNEIIFSIFSMVISCIMFGYVLGTIEVIVINYNSLKTRRREMLVCLNAFFKKYEIPRALRIKSKLYLSFLWEMRSSNDVDEGEVFELLSSELREMVCTYTRGMFFTNFFAFTRLDPKLLRKVMLGIVTNCYSPNDVVFSEGEKSRDLYYIVQGSVVLEDFKTKCIIHKLNKSNYFGEIAFFLASPRICTIVANDFLETFIITWESFSKCIEDESDAKEFISRLMDTSPNEALLELNIECYICKQIGHLSRNCSVFSFGKVAHFEQWKGSNRAKMLKVVEKSEPKNLMIKFKKFKPRKSKVFFNENYREHEQRGSLTIRSCSNVNLFLDSSEESGESLDSIKSEVDVIRKNSFDVSLLPESPRRTNKELNF